jgi:hypothetical protein
MAVIHWICLRFLLYLYCFGHTQFHQHAESILSFGILLEFGILFFNWHSGGMESKLGPLGTSATYWPIVPAPGDCEDGEFDGMNDRGNRSTRRKPALTPLCPSQIPLDQTRDWTRAAAVGFGILDYVSCRYISHNNANSWGPMASPSVCLE